MENPKLIDETNQAGMLVEFGMGTPEDEAANSIVIDVDRPITATFQGRELQLDELLLVLKNRESRANCGRRSSGQLSDELVSFRITL